MTFPLSFAGQHSQSFNIHTDRPNGVLFLVKQDTDSGVPIAGINAAADTLTLSQDLFQTNDLVMVATTGSLPGGIAPEPWYIYRFSAGVYSLSTQVIPSLPVEEFSAPSNSIQVPGALISFGERVRVVETGGFPTGLAAGVDYYVRALNQEPHLTPTIELYSSPLTGFQPNSVDISTNTFTQVGHGLTDQQLVTVRKTSIGALPSPLVENQTYKVSVADPNTFQLLDPDDDSVVDITSDASCSYEIITLGHIINLQPGGGGPCGFELIPLGSIVDILDTGSGTHSLVDITPVELGLDVTFDQGLHWYKTGIVFPSIRDQEILYPPGSAIEPYTGSGKKLRLTPSKPGSMTVLVSTIESLQEV